MSFDGILTATILVMAYFIILTSWIGYYNSIKKKGYSETKLGTVRFGIDFIILYLYYYLINTITSNLGPSDDLQPWMREEFFIVFVWLMPIIFAIYLAWDVAKYFEYRCESRKAKVDRLNRMVITLIFFGAFIAQSLVYSLVIMNAPPLKLGDVVIWDIIFVASTTLLILYYRGRKVIKTSKKFTIAKVSNKTPSKT